MTIGAISWEIAVKVTSGTPVLGSGGFEGVDSSACVFGDFGAATGLLITPFDSKRLELRICDILAFASDLKRTLAILAKLCFLNRAKMMS